MRPDHYRTLGVQPRAGEAEVRAAYLTLMRHHHPARRPGDAPSGETARRVNAAFEVLGDPRRRTAYDRARTPRATTRVGATARGACAPGEMQARPYSAARQSYSRAFLAASLRVGLTLLAVGAVLLLALTGT